LAFRTNFEEGVLTGSNGVPALFPGPDTNRLFHGQDENLTIPDFTSIRRFLNGGYNFIHLFGFDAVSQGVKRADTQPSGGCWFYRFLKL